jgi:hypothetical protein
MRNRPRLVASSSSTAKLFVDDLREVAALSNAENKCRSDIIRELVHEALRQRRLRAIGRDEGENYVRRVHQEAIAEGLAPLMNGIAELHRTVESVPEKCASEVRPLGDASLGKRLEALLGLMAHLLQRAVVTENVVKVLMTIGMQKDDLSPEEIKRQLAGHDETGLRQSQDLMKKVFGDQHLSSLTEKAK